MKALNIGVAAHITAAAPDGPRYAAFLSKLERSSIENGIWLCQNCAKLADNDENRYTIELLQAWKKSAEEMALRYVETGHASVTGPQSSSIGRAPETDAARGRMLGPSPFQPFGAMGLGVKSYIPRSCDDELNEAAESAAFIWLQGDFQFGKTSLLRRHGSWLPLNWTGVYADTQLLDGTTDTRFRRDFFAEVKKATNQWEPGAYVKTQFDWRVLRDLSEQRKIAFLVDEIGRCSEKMVVELLHGFHALADWAPGNIKVVVSFRDGPIPLLPNCGIQNPKHTGAWKIIHLGPLTADEVSRLIDFLPSSVSPLLQSRIDRLRGITHFKPQRVQHLLDKLWEIFRSSQGEFEVSHSFIDAWLDSEDVQ